MTDANTKKSRAMAAHPKYSTMVNEAIVVLKERGGSSRPAILKYIKSTYKVGDNPTIINNSIKRALKSGVTAKTLIQTKGVGASGSFKVAKAEAKPKKTAAKKTTKKIVKPKAVTKKPKKAVKPKKAAKSPKKAAKSPKKAAKSPKKAAKSPKKVAKPKKKAITPKKAVKPKKPAARKVVNPKKPTAKKSAKK